VLNKQYSFVPGCVGQPASASCNFTGSTSGRTYKGITEEAWNSLWTNPTAYPTTVDAGGDEEGFFVTDGDPFLTGLIEPGAGENWDPEGIPSWAGCETNRAHVMNAIIRLPFAQVDAISASIELELFTDAVWVFIDGILVLESGGASDEDRSRTSVLLASIDNLWDSGTAGVGNYLLEKGTAYVISVFKIDQHINSPPANIAYEQKFRAGGGT
jgi:hypothetical protein